MPVALSWISEPFECSPLGCVESARPSAARFDRKTMLRLVPSRHSSTVSPVKRGPEADMFSSTPQKKLLFSISRLCAERVEKASTSQPWRFGRPSLPTATRKWRMMTSCVFTLIPPRRMVMPGEGAVWPAMVTCGWVMVSEDLSRSIAPPTSNTMIRGPSRSSASARLPGPSLASVVTRTICPPAPPSVGSAAFTATGEAITNTHSASRQFTIYFMTVSSPLIASLTAKARSSKKN